MNTRKSKITAFLVTTVYDIAKYYIFSSVKGWLESLISANIRKQRKVLKRTVTLV